MKPAGVVISSVVLGTLLLLAPASAQAKGILIYNTGQETFRTGPLPEPFDKIDELKGYEAGYLCDITGVFWSYFSVRNCKPVAFKGDTYSDEPELAKAIAAKYPEASMERGLWGHYGWMLLAVGVVIGAGVWVKEKFAGGSDDDSKQDESKDKAA